MREILFRGKSYDTDEWLYGSFVMDATELRQREARKKDPLLANGFIRRYDFENQKVLMFEVDRDTVGQYTGLTDKNGKKIFEGDILRYCGVQNVVVSFENGQFVINHYAINLLCARNSESEVIGNIHDNPELLEVKE